MSEVQGFDLRLIHPFSLLMEGPSRSGKSSLVNKIIQEKDSCIDKTIKKIIFVYAFEDENTNALKEREDTVLLTNLTEVDEHLENDSLIVIDDRSLESSSTNATQITNYVLRLCSHANISLILILHRLFLGDKIRTISLNCSYLVYFRSPRSAGEIAHLARDIFGSKYKWVVEAYKIATRLPYSYIFIGKDIKLILLNKITFHVYL